MLIRPCFLSPCMYFRVRVKISSDPIIAHGSPLFEGDVVSVSMSVCPVYFASAAYSSTCCIIGESGDTHNRMHFLAPHMKHAMASKIAWVAGMRHAAVAHPALGCSCIRAASIVPRAPARLSHTERAPPFSGPPQDCASLAPSCKPSSVGGIAKRGFGGSRHRLQSHHAHARPWASGVLEARSGGGQGRGEGSISFPYDGPRPRVGAVAFFLAGYRTRPSAPPHLSSRRR
ncbi:hypothetical protein B0H14DRAFT_2824367 [Mycena olivaceomarginata]|nr:hypothetical protein B0H14DRAFT_2824367 [Mycena olivaceomarginata]